MKLFSFAIILILISPAVSAVDDDNSCMNIENKVCNFIAKIKGEDVYIYTAGKSSPVFVFPESETSVETVSFWRGDGRYIAIKEGSNADKSKEVFLFNSKLSEFGYLYLASGIDFNLNEKYWYGMYCSLSSAPFPDAVTSPFVWMVDKACKNKSENINEYKYIGSDLFFSVNSVIDGVGGQLSLVALNAKNNDNVNILNFGCVENCPLVNDFIGKINDKYIIKMSLNFNGDVVEGMYYYDNVRSEIPLKGVKINKEIFLDVKDDNGKITEIFKGTINNNEIQGVWNNKDNNTNYPFILYRALVK